MVDHHQIDDHQPNPLLKLAASSHDRSIPVLSSDLIQPSSSSSSERRALWKLDLSTIPILAMFYFLSFLDRANLASQGAQEISNHEIVLLLKVHESHLYIHLRRKRPTCRTSDEPALVRSRLFDGTDGHLYVPFGMVYTLASSPYILSELPANLLLKKLGPNLFLPGIVTIWGLITTMQGFVNSYSGLVAARFFLGLVEGGMFPAIVLYLSFFYTRRELQLRIALFFSAASLSGAFSGLLAYGIIRLDGKGNRPGWAWIFIIEGLFTFLWGIVSFFIFPASIDTNRYLTPSEKAILKERILRDRPTTEDQLERFSINEVIQAFKSPHVLINFVSLFMSGTALYSLAYFQPTIVHSLGYSESRSQLMSVPPFAVSFVVMLVTAYISDRYRSRGLVACGCAIMGMIGFVLFYVAEPDQNSLKYGSLFLSVSGVYSTIPPLSAWQSNNSEGHYRRACAIALGFVASNLGGILSTWLFPSSEKPRYRTGTLLSLCFCVGMVLTISLNLIWLKFANRRKRDHRETILSRYPNTHDSKLGEEVAPPDAEREAWMVLGDRHPDFEYTY